MPARLLALALLLATPAVAAASAEPRASSGTVRIVVGLRSTAGAQAVSRVAAAPVRQIGPLRAVVVDAPVGRSGQTLRRLRRSGAVRYAEPERLLRVSEVDATRRGDPIRRDQWSLPFIGIPAAWTVTRGAGVTVAVIDTGVAPAPDLEGRLLPGWNVFDRTSDASDDHGHGTHVAGTIAEVADNGIAGVGIAPEASILPVKVLDAAGQGPDSGVAEGIVWAADNGAKIVNLSLGGAQRSSILVDAVNYAKARDVLVVAAAGNAGGPVEYPARLSGVLSVGAVDGALEPTEFTNRGRGLDLVAPGVGIVQQTLGERPGTWANRPLDGTSMAAPHVSATAALVIASGRATTAVAVARRLQRTAQDLGPVGWDGGTGHGLIRADLAVGAVPPT